MRKAAQLVVLVVGFATATTAFALQETAAPALTDELQQIDSLAAAEFAKDKVGGLAVGVITSSGKIWTKSYGATGAEVASAPATHKTVYRIGSITKQFTALMLLQLVQQGKVRLSDPVEKYFPEINRVQGRIQSAPPITLVQLATHTAGLAAEPDEVEKFTAGPVEGWEGDLLRALGHTQYIHDPGSRYSYSNIGYAILGAALARAVGQDYVSYVEEHIFQPLGMTDSGFELNDTMRARLAVGYDIEAGGPDSTVSQQEHRGRGYKVPNGAVYSTVDDLAAFVSFQLGNGSETVLKQDQLDENFNRLIVSNPNLTGGYGLGFETFRRGDLQGFGHSGLVAGYESAAYFNRKSRTAVIMLRSATGGSFRGTRLCVNILQVLDAARPTNDLPRPK